MPEECLICKDKIKYLDAETKMECAICGESEGSKCCCVNGHFVCNDCHTRGLDQFYSTCLAETSDDPTEILEKLMALPFCHMHGPEHHVLVGAALLTAYKNAGGEVDLENGLREMDVRGKKVPGGVCGFWGACGAAISSGQFISIVTKSNPLTDEAWALSNKMTSRSLNSIGEVGGPRCCKRNGRLAIEQAVTFVRENLGVSMKTPEATPCKHIARNEQCIRERCPYYPKKN